MKPEEEIWKTRYKTYALVWMTLVILTGVTFSVAGMDLGGWTVLIALGDRGNEVRTRSELLHAPQVREATHL